MSVPTDGPPGGSANRGADQTGVQAAFAATLVDEWSRCGVATAVVCPGSRSTPLAMALADSPAVTVHVRLDERSAGFTALGSALASGAPAVVVTTSGTAAAELHPAVVEADLARVPLLAVTADRPPELRDVGAPQAIDQNLLFGRSTRWFCDPGVPEWTTRSTWRSLGARSVAEAVAGPSGPGPVHLNLPFREPLLGDAGGAGAQVPGRPERRPWHVALRGPVPPPPGLIEELVGTVLDRSIKGVIVAGARCGRPDDVLSVASALGWPVLADPRSGLRIPHPLVVGAADGILRSERFADAHHPNVLLQLGERWASKVVDGFCTASVAAGGHAIVVDPWGRWLDPGREAATLVRCDPGLLCAAVADHLSARGVTGSSGHRSGVPPVEDRESWAGRWREAQGAADAVIRAGLDAPGGRLDELSVASRLFGRLPESATLVVSSSMPVRDLEAVAAGRQGPPRVLANRGANGIDGVVSTALGVSLVSEGPVVAVVGDLAFLHDVSALVRAPTVEAPLTVVVVDNGGGGIFSFLDQAAVLDPSRFERLFGTPQSQDIIDVATGLGWPATDVGPDDGIEAFDRAVATAVGGRRCSVVRVRVPDRSTNVDHHRMLNRAVTDAVDAIDGVDQVGAVGVVGAVEGRSEQGRQAE